MKGAESMRKVLKVCEMHRYHTKVHEMHRDASRCMGCTGCTECTEMHESMRDAWRCMRVHEVHRMHWVHEGARECTRCTKCTIRNALTRCNALRPAAGPCGLGLYPDGVPAGERASSAHSHALAPGPGCPGPEPRGSRGSRAPMGVYECL